MSKIKLTESQYNRLENMLFETRFDVVLKKTIKVGDVIQLTYKNTTLNFKVIQSNNGQIIMDNIDSGANKNYRYFITFTSLQGDDLEIRRVHKTKEVDKLADVKSWPKLDLKNVTNFEVLRNGKVIDTADSPTPIIKEPNKTDKVGDTEEEPYKNIISDILLKMANAKENNGLVIEMVDGRRVPFCIEGNGSYNLSLGIYDMAQIEELNNWDSFSIKLNYSGGDDEDEESLYNKNINVLNSTDGGKTFVLRIKGFSGEKSKDILIKGIKNINITDTCDEDTPQIDTPDIEKATPPAPTKDEDLNAKAKVAYEKIINDPILKQAFYKQPSLWNLFVAELKGKKATGSGIVPTLDLVNRYENKKMDERLASTFKEGRDVWFDVLTEFEISYQDENNKPHTFTLDISKPQVAKVSGSEFLGNTKVRRLYNRKGGYKILLKEKLKDEKDTFMCDVVKMVKTKISTRPYTEKNVKIKLLPNSDGYKPLEKK